MSQDRQIIYITGAGPGDPNLLTLKAKEVLEKSDVILYDNLVSDETLKLALLINPDVQLIYAGKVPYNVEESVDREEVKKLLLKLVKEYKTICRLKGGDPNVFGRGGEEAVFLKEHNINFEIVPGVSSITAVPAYAGIPLTHRDACSSFTVISAHEDTNNPDSKIRWENFDAVNSTLVLLMGVKNLPKIIKKLILLGRKKDTPVAIVYCGTTSKQLTLITNLENAVRDVEDKKIQAPSVIIIGEVVNYREVLNWFETKPLFKKRILITRSHSQSQSFAEKLIKSGAEVINCPTVSYEIIEKEIYNKNIISNISNYDWIFFTSQNAVQFFFEILNKNYLDSRALANVQIAAVGYKTKLELLKYNIKADFVPKKFSVSELVNELAEKTNIRNKRILFPTQTGIQRDLPLENITTWFIYRPCFVEKLDTEIVNEIKKGIDVITFFSSNTAKHFYKLAQAYELHVPALMAVIGEETGKAVTELFGKVDIMAEPFTEDGLINSMERYFIENARTALKI